MKHESICENQTGQTRTYAGANDYCEPSGFAIGIKNQVVSKEGTCEVYAAIKARAEAQAMSERKLYRWIEDGHKIGMILTEAEYEARIAEARSRGADFGGGLKKGDEETPIGIAIMRFAEALNTGNFTVIRSEDEKASVEPIAKIERRKINYKI